MLVAGTDLPLPYYALPQLATQELTSPADPAVGATYAYTTARGFIEIPTQIVFVMTASATVAARTIEVSFFDSSGKFVARVIPVATQPASAVYVYGFYVTLPFAYGPVGRDLVSGLPTLVMSAGWQFQIGILNIQAGDQLSTIGVTTIRIPTGVGAGDPRTPKPAELVAPPITF